MNAKVYFPKSQKDVDWYYNYVDRIGEESLFKMRYYIFGLCNKLKVGEHINIDTWIAHVHKKCSEFENWNVDDTTDLFIKLLWCYMTESNGCYCFSNDFKNFRNYIHDARKMDKQLGIYTKEYQVKNYQSNGRGTWMQGIRTEALSTS